MHISCQIPQMRCFGEKIMKKGRDVLYLFFNAYPLCQIGTIQIKHIYVYMRLFHFFFNPDIEILAFLLSLA